MTFDPTIPNATHFVSADQPQITINFSQLNSIFDIDHVKYNDATVGNRGKHKQSTYIEQGSDPTTVANELALYSKDLATVSTLYLRKENNGTVIQMSGQDPTIAASGSTFLPGGIILKWGTATAATNTAVTFASAFPNNCYNVTLTSVEAGTSYNASGLVQVKSGSLSTTQFVLLTSGVARTIYYIAIGN